MKDFFNLTIVICLAMTVACSDSSTDNLTPSEESTSSDSTTEDIKYSLIILKLCNSKVANDFFLNMFSDQVFESEFNESIDEVRRDVFNNNPLGSVLTPENLERISQKVADEEAEINNSVYMYEYAKGIASCLNQHQSVDSDRYILLSNINSDIDHQTFFSFLHCKNSIEKRWEEDFDLDRLDRLPVSVAEITFNGFINSLGTCIPIEENESEGSSDNS